ncbi:UNVERIFIED_ORG: hypothetical protein ABIC54_004475 [Burkholderia sp. 1263]
MAFPNAQNNPAGAIPVWITAGQSGTTGPTNAQAGVSTKGTVGTTSAAIIAAGQFTGWVTVQNTHASQTLYVSFTAPATTTDIAIQAGAALTLAFGPTNALNGIGSGAGTTFAAVGY